ncbi:MAG: hypothetical protein CMN55_14095 [Sneathiella sp.]|jgi:hypothetical protein|uniref:NlpC/P60 family protein n=1 Tax=Sneathiella sp. TaxID=1964365 RepID=UPI000C504913|nr:NlpC/P60 family protein [Sneathiella sp.]MAL80214.1 hypothetical protein [Sneathiella sp.]
MDRGAEILTAARGWIGTPWRHQGRSARGLDCVGLVVMVARQIGLTPVDLPGYARRQDGARLLSHLHKQLDVSSLHNWNNGGIAIFRESQFPIHLGFLARDKDGPTVIHAHAGRRRVVEELLAPYGAPFLVFSFPEGAS